MRHAARSTFGQQHGDDVFGRVVGKELALVLLVPGNAVVLQQGDEVLRREPRQRRAAELRVLAYDVQYGSQQVFDIVHGRTPVCEHLGRKIEALRALPGREPRFELARSPTFGECLAGFERLEAAERNWLARPGLTAVLTVNAAGRVASVMIVTVAPSPAHVQRSGIYPGIGSGTVHEIAQRDTGTGR